MKDKKSIIGNTASSLLVFFSSFYIFHSLIPKDPAIHGDVIRSLLLVQDCLKDYGCHLRASPDTGSILGISHGAIFLHFLVFVHYFGGGIQECYITIALCAAMGVTVLYGLAKKIHGLPLVPMTPVIYLYIIVSNGGLALLWNPVLMHLPAVLFICASICYIKTRKLTFFIISAFILSIGIQTHLTFLMHLSGFLYLIFLTPKGKRFKTFILGAGIIIVFIMADSSAIFQNVHLSFPSGNGEPAERNVSFVLIALVAGWMGMSSVYLDWRIKKVVNHITLFLLIDCYLWWFFLSWFKSPDHRYWYSLWPGIILLTVESFYVLLSYIDVKIRHLKNAVNVIVILLCYLTIKGLISSSHLASPDFYAHEKNLFTMDDAREITNYLVLNEGCTYDKVFRHLRGGDQYYMLLHGLGYYFPMPPKSGTSKSGKGCEEDLAVFKTEAGKAKKPHLNEWTILKKGKKAIGIYRYKPYLKWDNFKACFVEQSSGMVNRCFEKEYSFTPSANPELLASRWPFGMLELAHRTPFTLYVQVPITIPAYQPPRTIFIPGYEDITDKCRGFIEEIVGIQYKGTLHSNKITITSSAYSQSGKIIFSWDFGTSACSLNSYKWMPPPVIEFSQENFNYYGIFSAAAAHTEMRKPKQSLAKSRISTLFKETGKSSVKYAVPQNPIITVPLGYVIVVMMLIAIGITASIIVCTLHFTTGSWPH